MSRIRALKPEAFQSETLAEVSLSAERTFFGMSTLADDRGRLVDKPAQINGELWSMRGGHTATELDGELVELEKCDEPLVCRYVGCDGKRYLHLITWDNHQRIDNPSKPRLPRCPHHLVSVTGKEEKCGKHEGPCLATLDSLLPPDISRDSQEITEDSQEPSRDIPEVSVPDLGSRTLDRGSRIVDLVREIPRTTAPGTALLDAFLTKASPRPGKADTQKLGQAIDSLVAEKTPLDVLAEALDRYHDKRDYRPGLLRNLAGDVVAEQAAAAAANGHARASPGRKHRAYQNPADDAFDKEL